MSDAAWTSLPTKLLLAELRKRQDDGERPECGTRGGGRYDTAAHVFALFLILALSTLSCGFPLLSRRASTRPLQKAVIFYCQHIGTGVLLATAFVHLLPTAFESLTDPCLPYFFSKGYTSLPGVVAMASAIAVVAVESYLTAQGAGHSHSHVHGLWDEDDANNGGQGAGASGANTRGEPLHPVDDDAEASQGLVSGVAPEFQEVSPSTQHHHKRRSSECDFHDGDSDLELEMAELDPAPTSNTRSGPYSSLKPNGHSHGHDAEPPAMGLSAADEHKRQMLQCLLLEAGILFHSVFIGMAISVATGPAFVVFLVAISFHQSFEGLALGSRIAAIQFPRGSLRPWLMVLAFGLTTPVGQAIGLGVHELYDPQSMGGLLVVGFMNAISAGLLVYASLVQLLAQDFLSDKSYRVLRGTQRFRAFLAVISGAILMALVGAFA